MTTNISGMSPLAARNIIPEKLAIEIHEYASTSIPIELKYEYVPRHARHNDDPIEEQINNIFLPSLSTENVATYVPSNWITPTIMAENSGEIEEPDSRKIVAV